LSKPILLFSGGLDSTVLLWKLKPNVKCLSFNYGQLHSKELDHAVEIARIVGVEHQIVNLSPMGHDQLIDHVSVSELIAAGSLTGQEPVPEGHYAAGSMKTTIVPNRNMIMLSIAVGWAVATHSKEVHWAAHAGDHAIYPDCRPNFFQMMREAIHFGNEWTPVELKAPFINMTKREIVNQGRALNVPFELTWSCYKGESKPCGRCGTCVERLEAFLLNDIPDPLEYENV
jgi:7-cyano-7-deazaguanine synthase